ncbi:STE/STE11/cdc15 protein kinase [Coprinopsis sp. MPI-PUGE-AT-0042]|nr:STE/STE11/cdc15 protein kinase [Coprinopsis sp. MPI-PUGE-AT-0042]
MATAVLSSTKVHNVSKPLPITHSRRPHAPPEPSSSRLPQPATTVDVFSSTSTTGDGASKSFQRFFENTFRTRSRKAPAPAVDEFATITSKAKKGKERDSGADVTTKEMLLRKVTFRGRSSRDEQAGDDAASKQPKERVAGKTSYMTPSLRQASMSSPALHLSSQALPSPRSQPAAIASSSSNADVSASPGRPKARRVSLQPPPLKEAQAPSTPTRHRSTRSTPMAIPPSPSTPSLPLSASPESVAPSRSRQLPAAPPRSPTRPSMSPTRTPSKISTSSAARAASPNLARSPSSARVRVASPSRLVSSSASHLPLSSSPPTTPHRPSFDRPPLEGRRSSGDYARRPTFDASSSSRLSPIPTHGDPSQVRPRSRTPSQRVYSQNRQVNISTGSLLSASNPEHRELLRSATSMLCKEILKPPPHMAKTEAGLRDWEEVEVRTRALVRLERIWSRPAAATPSSPIATASGEDRERKLFCEALRDGFVLCQLLNKQRASSVVRPDPREDGFAKTSNLTKFLAGCASYGLSNDDLFHRDDLIEATSDSLARVARTIIALIQFVESPQATRRYRTGTNSCPSRYPPSPYGTLSKSSCSTPNLHSPIDVHTSRKRYSPPSGLPPLRSYSPGENSQESIQTIRGPDDESMLEEDEEDEEDDEEQIDVPIIKRPPPPPIKSPLRRQLSTRPNEPSWSRVPSSPTRASVASSAQATVGDTSIRDSYANFNVRQSLASSVLTTTTGLSTTPSSLLDNGQGSSFGNKYGTIRTVTTEMTSAEPSLSREEGNAIADKLSRSPPIDVPMRPKRRSGEPHNIDLSRVAEETDDTASSGRTADGRSKSNANGSGDRQRPSKPAVHLRKGKWPDDFFDAMPESGRSITPIFTQDLESFSRAASPVTRSPRKIAVVADSSFNGDGAQRPQLPRRPTHRPRHSVDTPGLLPRQSLIRDGSPEGGLSISPSGRVMLRRHSSRPVTPRSASLAPRSDGSRGSDESLVPFPGAGTGEATGPPGSATSSGADTAVPVERLERPRLRGRFQSDVHGTNGRRGRPTSYDEAGVRPFRGRIESMVSMGVTSAATSASDLLAPRDSMDGSTGRALVVKEEGKPPTHFQLGNCIGRGQFGSVYRALNLNTGQMVAVKRIRLEGLKEEEVTQLMREVDLVKSLSHPSIVKYEGMARDDDTLSIVLEYAENGSLGQTLKAFGKFNERLVASYVVKILEGLHYLHNSHVVHCDLKAANILTTKTGNVKLSDFGVSLNLRAMEREMKDVAGTPNWMAPEVIELKGASEKSDIWSLGCTVIELLTGRPPYAEITNSMSVMFRIVEDDIPPLPEGCSELLQDFLKQCLQKDPNDRPTAELLCEHEWLRESWLDLKDLRPQDSIPFLRRVSTDMAKTDVSRYFAQESGDPPMSPISEKGFVPGDAGKIIPVGRRPSNLSMRAPPDNDIAPRDHNFVKTTFSKPMMCRVCLLHVKKSAVLCAQCSLISHARCASSAPPTCDLRAQLLLYAQYADKGNPASAYSNPADILGENKFPVALSEVPYIPSPPSASGKTDDDSLPPRSPLHAHDKHSDSPPTAFKFPFKRSRSNLTPEPSSPTTPTAPELEPRRRRISLLHKRSDRPTSFTSESGLSSLRSAATAAESINSGSGGRYTSNESSSGGQSSNARRYRSGLPSTTESDIHNKSSYYKSDISNSEVGVSRSGLKEPSGTPGSSRLDTHRHKRNAKSSGNCVIQ